MDETTQNPTLLSAIRALKISDNPKTRGFLYNALMGSTLLLPLADAPDKDTLQAGDKIAFAAGQTSEGEPLILAFTDLEALELWNPEGVPYITLPTKQLFPLLAAQNAPMLMLNIAGPIGGEITQREINWLAQGVTPTSPESIETETVPANTIRIGEPDPPPVPALTAFLSHQCSGHSGIQAAYLLTLQQGENSPDLVCAISFEPSLSDEMVDTILRELASATPHSIFEGISEVSFSFMPLRGRVGEQIRANLTAFYEAEGA